MHKATNCTICNLQFASPLDVFSLGLCVDCYEKHFDTLTENEKRPDFVKTLRLK